MRYIPADHLVDYLDQDLGCSEWLMIDQARVDQFANATEDHQFIHVDAERAAATPFGGTIAHGFLTLALIPRLIEGLMLAPEGTHMTVNYGLEGVRFIQPVRVGARVRLHLTLLQATQKRPGQWLLRARATLEIEGQAQPGFVAEPLLLCFL
ncbi:MaoC family dehydratase [Pseudomonas massiliensis]|uniref:MaoC family dehydratase n=1 Tax=Pseudomonas massiliensis TaxID=522492 RepID=UPI00058DE3EE|nr:MaoC family dehydratase [Pseudomonas massiliensis]